jgi:hypothetical protein
MALFMALRNKKMGEDVHDIFFEFSASGCAAGMVERKREEWRFRSAGSAKTVSP